jgi:hypothetical protein|tara:strand:- start:858 stop:986 length:129 start_codon:yes stop_codon:yes gene_type:complete
MFNFIIGVIFGILISSVGLSGVAHVVDDMVNKTKQVVQEQVK